jgi:hypothetical protein
MSASPTHYIFSPPLSHAQSSHSTARLSSLHAPRAGPFFSSAGLVAAADQLMQLANPTTSNHSSFPAGTSYDKQQAEATWPKKEGGVRRGLRGRYGCRTCRQRHLKCDETHPICDHCMKAKRDCIWNHAVRMSHDARSASFPSSMARKPTFDSATSTDEASTKHSREKRRLPRDGVGWNIGKGITNRFKKDESGDYIANLTTSIESTPLELLGNSLEASVFGFYIEQAGPWLDVTSPSRHFALTIPRLAISNPVLLYACLAYSSKTLFPGSSLSEQYSNACIKLLIPLLSDEVFVSSDETLLATLVILRHVEQYAEVSEDKGAHLSGSFSLIASQKVLPPHDSLPGSALWTYMRQDIRQAVLNRSSPKLTPSHGIQVGDFGGGQVVCESVWADRFCHLAALACTFAWGGNEGEVDGDELENLLECCKENLPKEYLPFHTSGRSIHFLASWHGT